MAAFSKKRVGFYDTVVYSRMSSFIPEKVPRISLVRADMEDVVNYFPGAYLVFDLESMTSIRELKYQVLQYDIPRNTSNESTLERLSYAVNKVRPQSGQTNYERARSMEEFGIVHTNETLFVTEVCL